MASSYAASMVRGLPRKQHQVFINFRGEELRNNFISHLETALMNDEINYYIDTGESEGIEIVFDRIDESDIALAVFSKRYSESKWCLDELVWIMENVEEKKLRVIPIFFDVKVDDVKHQRGDFGLNFYRNHHSETTKMHAWKKALRSATTYMGLILADFRSGRDFLAEIVAFVKKLIAITEIGEGTNMLSRNVPSLSSSGNASSRDIKEPKAALLLVRMRKCLQQLEEKLDFRSKETQIVGIVGVAGIGKTTLAEIHFHKWKYKLTFSIIVRGIRERSKTATGELTLLERVLLVGKSYDKAPIFRTRVFIVLDDVSEKTQIEFLLSNLDRIKKGSKIVITTRDKSLIKGLVHDTYVVPGMNDREALQLFSHYAFNGQDYTPTENFMKLSKKFVDYAQGNPQALKALGNELCGKDEVDWEKRLLTLPHFFSQKILTELLIISYDKLTDQQKDAFLDMATEEVTEPIEDWLSISRPRSYWEELRKSRNLKVMNTRSKEDICRLLERRTVTDFLASGLREKIDNNLMMSRVQTHSNKHSEKWELQQEDEEEKNETEEEVKEEEPLATSKVDPGNEERKQDNVRESSAVVTYDEPLLKHPEVFINFRGAELHHGFVDQLVKVLKRDGVNVYIDVDELLREDLADLLFKRIEESRIALVIFSSRYTESRWCLNELVKIKELMEEGKILVIPIFHKVKQVEVTQLKGDFGVTFWNLWRINRDYHIIKWKEALKSVGSMKGIYLNEHGSEYEFITLTVKEVLEKLSLQKGEKPSIVLSTEKGKSTDLLTGKGEKHETFLNKCQLFGMEQRMEQLERKLEFDCKETRIIGVVGMPGIGKTTLAMMLHEKWSCKFIRCVPLLGIRKMSEEYGAVWLRKTLLEVLLEGEFPEISDETTHEFVKVELLQKKIFAVFDDVSDKKQLEFLLGNLDWIKKGSKIVITTSDKSLLEGFAHCTYVVPLLNSKDAFQILTYHAFFNQISPSKTLLAISRVFVDNVGGNPLALKLLGYQLYEKPEEQWKEKLLQLTRGFSSEIRDVLRFSIDQLSKRQKDVFLDIVFFFRSENEYFVRSLLDSGDPDSTDVVSEVRDLANKFLITISESRVDVNLYTLCKYLGSPERHRLCTYEDIINKLMTKEKLEANNVRGIFLDMSKVAESIALERMTFPNMLNLRYLKIYDSCCHRRCKADCKLYFHDGLKFPLQEVRYLHWLKFPLKELPSDFNPKNLVDLRLPYSKIVHVWNGVKDTPRLKWVDLSHSSKLLDLSALSNAKKVQTLNLEGCTVLKELPVDIENMKSLVFLNLRGCIRLSYLPEMNLLSLKTLILSGCANLKEFQLISESLEVLHLDGTAIKELPISIKKLQRLVILNLKDCKILKCLPNCLKELKALEELILSGCSRLKNLSDLRESMKHLRSLLIDRIGAKEMPNILCITKAKDRASVDMFVESIGPSKWPIDVSGVSSLQRLSLSGNDFVSLKTDIGKLYNLKWLDVKQCKKLISIPMLPPRLEYFDAHGCDSLERVANPLALPVLSDQIHVTFNFSNCNKLDQDAKDSIISYTRWRSQLVLDELIRYNGGVVLEALIGTCLPGLDVPAWFTHQASGSVLEPKLPTQWCGNWFTGIALCAVIVFPAYHNQRNRFLVKCNCVFNYEDGSHIRFSCTIGSWSEPSSTPGKIEPSHVFIGYTSMLNIKKYGEEQVEEGCSHTKASFEFQVTDGTQVLEGCEVRKCGFSLVYATDEWANICCDAKNVVIPEKIENILGETRSYGNSGSNDDIQYESYFDLTLGIDETFFSEAESDATPYLQKIFENKRVDLLNEENDGGNIIVSAYHDNTSSGNLEKLKMHSLVGVELRLKQMEKVLYSTPGNTHIVGVVGMHGIGKSTLATLLFEKRGCKFPSHLFLTMSKEYSLEQLRRVFLKELLKHVNQDINDETTHESVKDKLLHTKVFVVLDDVSDKKQLEFLLGNLNWVKKGSKIVITTCDKSLLEGLAHNIYVVPQLSNREAFRLLTYHAFYNQICPSETFMLLSRMFVDNAGGNPRDLMSLGNVLCGKDEAFWQHELQRVRKSFNMKIRDIWRCAIDQPNERQRDVFLDIESKYFVRSLLNSGNPEAVSEVRDLIDKFLITISGGRVEMHDQLHTLGRGSPGQHRGWHYKDIIDKLTKIKQQEANNVRGIILDMSEITESIALECMTFIDMRNLQYLKIYDSCCPRQRKADCNLYFPDGIEFTLEDVRYLHWVEFPLEELPPDFNPENLVDLKLPYSKIERVWEGVKDTPRLKWVDLSYSSKLLDLSALLKADNLQRLNLEGCTSLDALPVEIQNMKSLVFLNLRGCTLLCSLPEMNLISLKTLILSDCSNLKEFQLVSETVEFLHLDGTAIKGLPPSIQNLRSLVVLNLKNCKMLECVPKCLGELKALDELILSGCSRLKNLSDVRESMKHLQSLLLDGTGAKEMPSVSCFTGSVDPVSADMFLLPIRSHRSMREWLCGVNGVSLLRRLCLSGNDFVILQPDIGKLYNLKWLDVKNCKRLRSVPMLPPRLQYFDAHGCDALETVANPLAFPVSSEQIHAIFNFSNCYKLDQDAKDSIISYTRWKSQLVLDELSQYNGGLVLEVLIGTCFPGWEVPAWFIHQALGPVLNSKLPPHWCDNRFTGIGLCAVIVFHGSYDQRKHVVVKCNCEFKNEDGSIIRFSCTVGGWREPSNTPRKIESSHVFIGFTSKLDINKITEGGDEEKCFCTETSIKFKVIDGTEEINGCEVLKCGFSLLYAPEERRNICSEHTCL